MSEWKRNKEIPLTEIKSFNDLVQGLKKLRVVVEAQIEQDRKAQEELKTKLEKIRHGGAD
jgi:hypothetical protein